MSDTEIIKRLAEWMGWKWQRQPKCWVGDKGIVEAFEEWDPLGSLDDCRRVEDEIVRRGFLEEYVAALFDVSMDDDPDTDDPHVRFVRATARQRCEAILRVIEEE